MNFLPKSAWRYAVMMLFLLAVVAWAAFSIISHMEERLVDLRNTQAITELSVAVWALTMGVMFMTGAFGLWAIRSTAEIEGRRRIGRFVAAMDYISDGLVLLDRQGRVGGFNPALQQLIPIPDADPHDRPLLDLFPCVDQADMNCLTDLTGAREFERDCVYPEGLRTLRFRSQPSSGVRLVLVSDVTDMRSQEMRLRQIALLQLVGRIAAGVAHDFNNILCGISGHAALMERGGLTPDAMGESLKVIQKETQKGALLSRQLLALSRAGMSGKPGAHVERHLEDAASLLRIGLTPAWTVKVETEVSLPPVPLTPGQIEQIILNLGLLAADAQSMPGALHIKLTRPGAGSLTNVTDDFAVVLLISAETAPASDKSADMVESDSVPRLDVAMDNEGGAILSVVQSLVEEIHGKLDHLAGGAGACVYRVCLPHLALSDTELDMDNDILPTELGDYLAGWRIILAYGDDTRKGLDGALRNLGVTVIRRESMMALLGGVDDLQKQDALVLDQDLMGDESEGLIKAVLKLCPTQGIVVLCRDPSLMPSELKKTVAFAAHGENTGRIMQLLIIAKALRASSKTIA